jgi:hypothetical protein
MTFDRMADAQDELIQHNAFAAIRNVKPENLRKVLEYLREAYMKEIGDPHTFTPVADALMELIKLVGSSMTMRVRREAAPQEGP